MQQVASGPPVRAAAPGSDRARPGPGRAPRSRRTADARGPGYLPARSARPRATWSSQSRRTDHQVKDRPPTDSHPAGSNGVPVGRPAACAEPATAFTTTTIIRLLSPTGPARSLRPRLSGQAEHGRSSAGPMAARTQGGPPPSARSRIFADEADDRRPGDDAGQDHHRGMAASRGPVLPRRTLPRPPRPARPA